MRTSDTGEFTLQNRFNLKADTSQKSSVAKPFSIRLTDEEKSHLLSKAGKQPLGAYCREVLLAEKAVTRRTLPNPEIAQQQYAALLSALGESHLSNNLNQLAHHANTGSINVSDDIEQQLQEAYEAVIEMRKALLIALGLKTAD